MPAEAGDIAVVYRAVGPDDVILRRELDELAQARGAELHYVLGDHREQELLSSAHLTRLVPDIAERDVYVCGSPAMTEATRASLDRSGVPRRHIVTERFAFYDAQRGRSARRHGRRRRAARVLRHGAAADAEPELRAAGGGAAARRGAAAGAGTRSANGPLVTTPFSAIQVRATCSRAASSASRRSR